LVEKTQDRVARFARALGLSLYDRELELNGIPIVFYHDADVVLGVIMGLEAQDYGRSPHQLVVRALLSCGFLGKIHMLRPHAFELNKELGRQSQFATIRDQEAFLDKAREFLRSKGIWDAMSQLDDVVTGKGPDDGSDERDRVERFVEILRKKPGEIFARIEQANGTWCHRLRRYERDKILSFDKMGPEMYELLPANEDVVCKINKILGAKRPGLSINVFQDAAALTCLVYFIRQREEESSSEIVRFYTETMTNLGELIYGDDELRSLLSYKTAPVSGMAAPIDSEVVIRDADYFVMRAWFAELTMTGGRGSLGTLEDLKTLSEKIEDTLSSSEADFDEAMKQIELGGRELRALIGDFEQLATMDNVWTSGRIPESLQKFEVLRQWTRVFDFAARSDTGVLVSEQIQEVRSRLESKVYRMGRWTRDFRKVVEATLRTRQRFESKIDDVMRDLGLVRWGYSLSPSEQAELIDLLDSLLRREDEGDIAAHASRAAMWMDEARTNPRRCMLVCGVLWSIHCYEQLVDLADECVAGTGGGQVPPSLLVIQAAAEMRIGRAATHDERRAIVNRIWGLYEGLSGAQRRGVLLGVGYVLYHAWRLSNLGGMITTDTEADVASEIAEWARKSFFLGGEAHKALRENQLAWAYSVNHCAYVGTMTGVEAGEIQKYIIELGRLETVTAVWNARFSDTVGTFFLTAAEKDWEQTDPDKRKDLDLSVSLERAKTYLEKARARHIGDIDVEEHLTRLAILKRNYDEVKRVVPGGGSRQE